ncbi:AcylCoA dehydrogenase family member 9 mitochondriallike, partial [Caligus rogercresseyi]
MPSIAEGFYPVPEPPDDVSFAKLHIRAPSISEVRQWDGFQVMEASGLWEKLNTSAQWQEDQRLFLSGFMGPRPALQSGMQGIESEGEWAHCVSAAINSGGGVLPKYKETPEGKKVIRGFEPFVLNAGAADNFVVWAIHENNSEELLAFLVPKSSSGLSIDDAVQSTSVFQWKDGESISKTASLSKNARIFLSARILGKLTHLFNTTFKIMNEKRKFGKWFSDFELVQSRLSNSASQLYALQSSVYLVSGLADSNPINYELDSALLQILSESIATSIVKECSSLLGVDRLKNNGVETIIKDIEFTYSSLPLSMDVTRCYASLLGIQGLGHEVGSITRVRRNGVADPVESIKDKWDFSRRIKARRKKVKSLGLSGYMHSQFEESINEFEDYLLRFRLMVEASLAIHGRNIQLEERELSRMAEYASELLSHVSILSRLNLLSTTPGGYRKEYEKCLGYTYIREKASKLNTLQEQIGN